MASPPASCVKKTVCFTSTPSSTHSSLTRSPASSHQAHGSSASGSLHKSSSLSALSACLDSVGLSHHLRVLRTQRVTISDVASGVIGAKELSLFGFAHVEAAAFISAAKEQEANRILAQAAPRHIALAVATTSGSMSMNVLQTALGKASESKGEALQALQAAREEVRVKQKAVRHAEEEASLRTATAAIVEKAAIAAAEAEVMELANRTAALAARESESRRESLLEAAVSECEARMQEAEREQEAAVRRVREELLSEMEAEREGWGVTVEGLERRLAGAEEAGRAAREAAQWTSAAAAMEAKRAAALQEEVQALRAQLVEAEAEAEMQLKEEVEAVIERERARHEEAAAAAAAAQKEALQALREEMAREREEMLAKAAADLSAAVAAETKRCMSIVEEAESAKMAAESAAELEAVEAAEAARVVARQTAKVVRLEDELRLAQRAAEDAEREMRTLQRQVSKVAPAMLQKARNSSPETQRSRRLSGGAQPPQYKRSASVLSTGSSISLGSSTSGFVSARSSCGSPSP